MSNIETAPQDQIEIPSSDFVTKFTDERKYWSESVISLGRRFNIIENLAELQVDLYSQRQQIVEYQFKLVSLHTKIKKLFSIEWKKAYEEAGRNDDIRFSEKEKTKTAEAITSTIKFKQESVSNQIDFFKETLKTVDSMIFGVKHRIEIENFKIGMK